MTEPRKTIFEVQVKALIGSWIITPDKNTLDAAFAIINSEIERNRKEAVRDFAEKLKYQEFDYDHERFNQRIEAAIKDLEDAARGGAKAEIDAKVNALSEVSQKLGEKVYADMQAQAGEGAAAGAGAAAGGAQQQAQPQDDNVVDAEFKEVNDKK